MNSADHRCMARAIQLAKRGIYSTDPNPRVGCVITNFKGDILGEAWHQFAGEAHAEIIALNQVKHNARAGQKDTAAHTAYVSLEPCCHFGKTGPCSQALIQAKLSRVVIAMLDPNPLVAGKGVQDLKAAGIIVESGLLQSEAEALNPGFIKRMRFDTPRVIVKTAMSLDGRTALASGESKWITTEDARADVHRLRARSSAIVTGIGTLLQDDPMLNARLPSDIDVVQPLRVILDSKLRTAPTAKIFSHSEKVVIYSTVADSEKLAKFSSIDAEFHRVPEIGGRTDLSEVLTHLARDYAINEVMVEAGAQLTGAFIQAKLVDELVIYMAPNLLGNNARAAFDFFGIDTMQNKIRLENVRTRMIGADIRINATIHYD